MQHSAVLVDRVLVNRMLLQTYMAGRVSRGFGLRSELSKQKSVKKQPWLLVRKCVQVLVCKCTSLPRCGRWCFHRCVQKVRGGPGEPYVAADLPGRQSQRQETTLGAGVHVMRQCVQNAVCKSTSTKSA